MNSNNKHIVFIIILLIIIFFVFNYDVYIIQKNEEICKPIYITKRDMFDNINNTEQNIYNIAIEKFKNLDLYENIIPNIKNNYKKIVMGNVIDVLNNIPINLNNNIKQILEYYGYIYENSNSIDDFYKNIYYDSSNDNSVISKKKIMISKLTKRPSNYKYAQLIIFLIDQFDFHNTKNIKNDHKNNVNNNNDDNHDNNDDNNDDNNKDNNNDEDDDDDNDDDEE